MPKVTNIKATYQVSIPAPYTSWRELWEKKTNQHFSTCANQECNNLASVGRPVKLTDGNPAVFITPLCVHCQHPSNQHTYEVSQYQLVRL